ncbi:hypothetical protein JXO52_14510 [bacterium]|nr:hypothetical protein [bacterium]
MLWKNKDKKEKACADILRVIRPGDVVNQANTVQWWEIFISFGIWGIRKYQRHLFGRDAETGDDHTMLFFDRDKTLSVEPPRAIFKPLEKYCLTDISIYRLQEHHVTPGDIALMNEASADLIGTDYDIGQLVDILINGLLGFEHTLKIKLFDFGNRKKVCSVGVRAVYEYLYQKRIKSGEDVRDTWLFNEINPAKWPEHVVRHYKGTDVEATTPAHFANSDYFGNEFRLVARFRNGKRIYPDTALGFLRKTAGSIKRFLIGP